MTIRLLTDWPYKRASNAGYVTIPAGSIVSVFDAATETGMIAAKVAAASAAAVTWTPPSDAPIYTELLPAEVAATRSLVSGAGDFVDLSYLPGWALAAAGPGYLFHAGRTLLHNGQPLASL